MKTKNDSLAADSSANSDLPTGEMLLSASPLTLKAVRSIAEQIRGAEDLGAIRALVREQVEMLDRLIKQSEAQDDLIYEWAKGA